eukprot:6940963-Prymnesium_polylepis.2
MLQQRSPWPRRPTESASAQGGSSRSSSQQPPKPTATSRSRRRRRKVRAPTVPWTARRVPRPTQCATCRAHWRWRQRSRYIGFILGGGAARLGEPPRATAAGAADVPRAEGAAAR